MPEQPAEERAMPAEELPRENNSILGAHLGHQEVERVVVAIDEIMEYIPPEQWMQDTPIINLLCKELGYEDKNEFEDALQGEFCDFLKVMPHIETRDPEAGEEGGIRFRFKALPPEADRVPIKFVYRIRSPADLWRVCLKSPKATMAIPELEFEMSADGRRHVDAVYNHLAAAIFNLGTHARSEMPDADESTKFKIMETATALNWLLDVEQPWTIVLTDPDGTSDFKPSGEEDGSIIVIRNPPEDDTTGEEGLGAFLAAGPWMGREE